MHRLRIVLAILAAACGRSGTSAHVADADLSELRPSQARLIDEARRSVHDAQNALAKSKLSAQNALDELRTAQTEATKASADDKAVRGLEAHAKATHAPAAMMQAAREREEANAEVRAAEAHASYAQKRLDAERAQVAADEQAVDVTSLRVEQAKLYSLEDAKAPAAKKYDRGRFDGQLHDAAAQWEDRESKARELRRTAIALRQLWQQREEQLDEARRGER